MNKSKLALSLAMGLSLMGVGMANNAVMAETNTNGLFQMTEVAAPMLVANDSEHKCGAGACGSSEKKDGEHKCSSSSCNHKDGEHSCGSKDGEHQCGSKDGEHNCGSKDHTDH